MIDLYTHSSPNAYKISICLEELKLEYSTIPVNLEKGEQRRAEFLTLNPNGKVPAIVDHDSGQALFESGAILLYLADKAKHLIAPVGAQRWEVITWLFFHAATVGPTLAQRANFGVFATEKVPSVIARFTKESERLFGVLDERLSNREFLCGDYSIADIAHFGWLHIAHVAGFTFESFLHLSSWHERLLDRPAVQRGLRVPAPPSGL
jgi:glutathione S-transferase